MLAIDGQPLCLRRRLALSVGVREECLIIFGMTPSGSSKFARTLELFKGIETRRVQETIPRDFTTGICGDQRFADKVRDMVDNVRQTRIGRRWRLQPPM